MESKMFLLGRNGLEPVKNAELVKGQIIFLNGYGQDEYSHDRLAIYDSYETDFGKRYKCVNLDKFDFKIQEAFSIRPISAKFGIGMYYKENDFASDEEIVNAIQKTNELNVVRQANKIVAQEEARIKEEERKQRLEKLRTNGIEESGEYHSELRTKEIAKLCRTKLTKEFKGLKLSIRTSFNHIYVDIMGTSEAILIESKERYSLNHYHLADDKGLTEYGLKLTQRINDLFSSFNYDKSDIQSDYFDVNFYFSLGIGQYDKPFKLNS